MQHFVVLETVGDPRVASSHRLCLEASGIEVMTEKINIIADKNSSVSGYRVFVPMKDRRKATELLKTALHHQARL